MEESKLHRLGALLGRGGQLTPRVRGQVLTQTVLPRFSFISLKKGNRKQTQDVEDKQYKRRQWLK